MRDSTVDLIIVEPPGDQEMWTFYSPQLPGLSAGRDTAEELLTELPEILALVGKQYPSDQFQQHTEHIHSVPDVDLILRIAADSHLEQRQHVFAQVKAALAISEQRERFTQYPRNRIGYVTVICAVESDHIGRISSQLDPTGDSAVVCATADDSSLWVMPITNDSELVDETESMQELGWDYKTSVGHLLRTEYALQDGRRAVFA